MAFTTGIESWSTTASSNDDADSTINWLENQAPSTVNGSARAMMAILKGWHDKVVVSRLIGGLTLSNNGTDATNDIDVAAGVCADSTNAVLINLTSSITKRLDAAWAVGTNQGGLDTGTIANTTYHVFAIMRSDTGVVDVLFSTSASSPTMPTNYDYKRRIGSIIRSGATILAFSQLGDEFLLDVPVSDVSLSDPGTGGALHTLTVPVGIKVIAKISSLYQDLTAGAAGQMLFTSPDQTDTTASSTLFSLYLTGATAGSPTTASGEFHVRTNTSAQIRANINQSNSDYRFRITTHGWFDTRGKDA